MILSIQYIIRIYFNELLILWINLTTKSMKIDIQQMNDETTVLSALLRSKHV